MKGAMALALLVAFGTGAQTCHAQSAPRPLERVVISGRGYLRLNDWAKANNFELRWPKRDELLQLTNRFAHIVFSKDSRQAELNGINVLLSYPVVFNGGAAYISEVDLQTAVRPVLTPPKNWSGAKV